MRSHRTLFSYFQYRFTGNKKLRCSLPNGAISKKPIGGLGGAWISQYCVSNSFLVSWFFYFLCSNISQRPSKLVLKEKMIYPLCALAYCRNSPDAKSKYMIHFSDSMDILANFCVEVGTSDISMAKGSEMNHQA